MFLSLIRFVTGFPDGGRVDDALIAVREVKTGGEDCSSNPGGNIRQAV